MAKLNIIVGTHGHFGEELVKSAELITGKMEGVRTLSLLPEMSFEDFMKNAEEVLSTTEKPYIRICRWMESIISIRRCSMWQFILS